MTEYNETQHMTIRVNGEERRIFVAPADTLLYTLRRGLGLTGTKLGCENGDCGACTVQVDGQPIKSCYTLTVDVGDREITTIEGLQNAPAQAGFHQEYGFQCGFCTSGFIMNTDALIRNHPDGDALGQAETDRDWMQSNICRCTGYEGIRNALAHGRRRAGS
jgi:carbon-monoxide dehydrogenase small subunit